jgi:hypothetical protein
MRGLQFYFECGLAHNGPLVLTLPVATIPLKLNVLLFGQLDNCFGEGRTNLRRVWPMS